MSKHCPCVKKHEKILPKLRNLEILTNDHDKSKMQSDIVKELVQVETGDIVLNESTRQTIISEKINQIAESSPQK